MALLVKPTTMTCNFFRNSNLCVVRHSSGYRLKPGSLKSPALDVNKSENEKFEEKVRDAMLHKQKSPLRGFERIRVSAALQKKHLPLPNEPFYGRDDLPTYGSYSNYVKEAERERKNLRNKKIFWKTMDQWWKVHLSNPHYVNIGLSKPMRTKRSKKERQELKKELSRIWHDPGREKAARERTLNINVDEFLSNWESSSSGVSDIHKVAMHYNIYKDLFGHGEFYPVVTMDVGYDCGDDFINPVYYGNEITPTEASNEANIFYDCEPDTLWSLILTNPDGNLEDNNAEYIHWFIGNIRGNNLSSGELLFDYLPPIPARGTGYQRMVFLLFQQKHEIDFSDYKKELPCLQLRDRSFKTRSFFRKFQSDLTPVSLRFFQTKWDVGVQDTYQHTLGMPEPVYEFVPTDVEKLGSLKLWPHKKTLTWLKKFMPKEPIYPGGGKFT